MYFGNTAPTKVEPVEGQVVFGVDMSAFETIGLFDTARNDTLWVFGDFNGWQGCRDERRLDECYMFREPGGTNFAAAVPLTQRPGWNAGYKYFLDFNDTEFEAQFGVPPPSGWEEVTGPVSIASLILQETQAAHRFYLYPTSMMRHR